MTTSALPYQEPTCTKTGFDPLAVLLSPMLCTGATSKIVNAHNETKHNAKSSLIQPPGITALSIVARIPH